MELPGIAEESGVTMLRVMASELSAGSAVLSAFITATIRIGLGYQGVAHLADQLGRGRELVSEWFEGVVSDAAISIIRTSEDQANIAAGLAQAAQAERSGH